MDNQQPETGEPPIRSFRPQEILLFLSGIMFLCWVLGSGLLALALNWSGFEPADGLSFLDSDSPLELRNFARALLLLNHLMMFLVPALLTASLFYKSKWQFELGTRPAPGLQALGLGILFMAAAFPLAQTLFQANSWLVEKATFLAPLLELEKATIGMIEGMLHMASPWEMGFSLLVMAAVPAIGEEMVFRGFVQRLLEKWTAKPYLAILLSSLIFGLVHFEVQRLLAIVLMGLVLGLLYHWTRSLWVSIAAHLLFNGSQVVAAYFYQEDLEKMAAAEGGAMPWYVTLASLPILFFIGKKLVPMREE